MKSNIFIPKKINVGYQNRSDTYTGKLAYVIYYDEKGKLRKEASWNGWRDQNIPNEEFDNVPTEGFVLNKKVGGVEESWGWDVRKTYTRVYDPRGFEFEISIPNLLWILECCSSVKGKGLEGEFVYGWDGKELVLTPVDSPDYKEITEYNSILYENNFIKAKDLKIGATYLGKDNIQYVYMGKFDMYDHGYIKNDMFFPTYKQLAKYCEKNNIPPKNNRSYYDSLYDYEYGYGLVGKQHCFYYEREKPYAKGEFVDEFIWKSSLSKFLISTVDNNCHPNYADYFELLECTTEYSPIDHSKDTYHEMTFNDFLERDIYKRLDGSVCYYRDINFYASIDGRIEVFQIQHQGSIDDNKHILYKYTNSNKNHDKIKVLDIFPTEIVEEKVGFWNMRIEKVKRMAPVSIEEIYEKMKPLYKQVYLANGKEYRKEHTA